MAVVFFFFINETMFLYGRNRLFLLVLSILLQGGNTNIVNAFFISLFLYHKLLQNLAALNNKHLLSHGFIGSGIWAWPTGVVLVQSLL